jgi:hypothetical protein
MAVVVNNLYFSDSKVVFLFGKAASIDKVVKSLKDLKLDLF